MCELWWSHFFFFSPNEATASPIEMLCDVKRCNKVSRDYQICRHWALEIQLPVVVAHHSIASATCGNEMENRKIIQFQLPHKLLLWKIKQFDRFDTYFLSSHCWSIDEIAPFSSVSGGGGITWEQKKWEHEHWINGHALTAWWWNHDKKFRECLIKKKWKTFNERYFNLIRQRCAVCCSRCKDSFDVQRFLSLHNII